MTEMELLQEIEDLKRRVQEQEDIEDIRRLRRRYAECADGGWPEHNGGRTHISAFADLFTEDGVQDEGKVGARMVGREAIREAFSPEGMGRIPFCVHFYLNGDIRVNKDGVTATGDWTEAWVGTFPDGAQAISVGYYHDTYRKVPEKGWLFQEVVIEAARTGILNSDQPFEWAAIEQEDVSAR